MRQFFLALLVVVVQSGTLLGQTDPHDLPVLKGPYLGQKPPGATPEMFASGVVSTGLSELNSVFSPDGKEFYFCVRNLVSSTLFVMRCRNGIWGKPETLPFASVYDDIDISLSPDGKRLFFSSNRPLSGGGDPKKDYDIWMCERKGKSWGDPIHLGDSVNSERDDFYPVVSNSGTLFFNSQRAGEGTNDIYMAKYIDGRFQKAEKLGPEINTENREFDAFIAPDESFLIFSSERGGPADLYISFKKGDGAWTVAKTMGMVINGAGPEFAPYLSPDGKYLFFTKATMPVNRPTGKPYQYTDYLGMLNSPDNASTNIWWISANIISELRSKQLQ